MPVTSIGVFPHGSEFTSNAGDAGLIPGLGRSSPGGGHGTNTRICGIFWYSCLENPMDRGAWWAAIHGVTKSDMTYWLNNNNRETKALEVTHFHPWYTFPFFFISFFVSLSSLYLFDFFFWRLNTSIKDLYDLLLSPQAFQNQLKCFGKNLKKPGYGPSCSLATHKGEILLSSVKCSYCNLG